MPMFRVPVEIVGYIQVTAENAEDAEIRVHRFPIESVAAECEMQGGYSVYEAIEETSETKCTGTTQTSSPPSS